MVTVLSQWLHDVQVNTMSSFQCFIQICLIVLLLGNPAIKHVQRQNLISLEFDYKINWCINFFQEKKYIWKLKKMHSMLFINIFHFSFSDLVSVFVILLVLYVYLAYIKLFAFNFSTSTLASNQKACRGNYLLLFFVVLVHFETTAVFQK